MILLDILWRVCLYWQESPREPRYDATVGQPVTLQISTSNFFIDPRNKDDQE